MTYLQAIIIAIVEGLTEFLPISSTGHMIIAEAFLKIEDKEFAKLFTVCIQFGAILSVVVLYWKRFFKSFDFYFKLIAGFIPAVIVGLLLKKHIDALLENVTVVAIALLLGGIILLFIDKIFQDNIREKIINYKDAFVIGVFQCISMIPGVSRSAATIIGGMTMGLTRAQAAEFSFFLAVPTMFAATIKELYDYYEKGIVISSDQINLLLVGNAVAFIVALIAIKGFISFLKRKGFKHFGYYRIIVGASLLILIYVFRYDLHMAG
ncbi:MAG: undecaprenyl-diphosphate phosphatase [Bacteroidetes bacterium]|nr:undecaprenyl-diphosphate phosphatase [Bacteroidota bacterium]